MIAGHFNPPLVRIDLFDAAGNTVLLIRHRSGRIPSIALLDHAEATAAKLWPSLKPEIHTVLRRRSGRLEARFWNPDRSPEKMCGNAMRSIGMALHMEGDAHGATVQTPYGPVHVKSDGVHAGMALPFSAIFIRRLPDAFHVEVGTPHRVYHCERLDAEWVAALGNRMSTRPMPVNATFFTEGADSLIARTFERGVGETRSCGTGAIAAAVIHRQLALTAGRSTKSVVRFNSGEQLHVSIERGRDLVNLWGSCTHLAGTDRGYEREDESAINHSILA